MISKKKHLLEDERKESYDTEINFFNLFFSLLSFPCNLGDKNQKTKNQKKKKKYRGLRNSQGEKICFFPVSKVRHDND